MEAVRAALQAILDNDGEGWQLGASFVVVMGIERITNGGIEAVAWYTHPAGQADWTTDGLLRAAVDLRAGFDED